MIKMWISILLGQDCTLGRGSPLSDGQYVWKSLHQSSGASHLLLRGVQIEDASFPGRSSDAATCNSYTCKTSRDESEGLLKFASESCPPSRQLGGIYKWLKQMKSNFLAFPWDSMSRMVLETWFLFTRLGQLGTPVFFSNICFSLGLLWRIWKFSELFRCEQNDGVRFRRDVTAVMMSESIEIILGVLP